MVCLYLFVFLNNATVNVHQMLQPVTGYNPHCTLQCRLLRRQENPSWWNETPYGATSVEAIERESAPKFVEEIMPLSCLL